MTCICPQYLSPHSEDKINIVQLQQYVLSISYKCSGPEPIFAGPIVGAIIDDCWALIVLHILPTTSPTNHSHVDNAPPLHH